MSKREKKTVPKKDIEQQLYSIRAKQAEAIYNNLLSTSMMCGEAIATFRTKDCTTTVKCLAGKKFYYSYDSWNEHGVPETSEDIGEVFGELYNKNKVLEFLNVNIKVGNIGTVAGKKEEIIKLLNRTGTSTTVAQLTSYLNEDYRGSKKVSRTDLSKQDKKYEEEIEKILDELIKKKFIKRGKNIMGRATEYHLINNPFKDSEDEEQEEQQDEESDDE